MRFAMRVGNGIYPFSYRTYFELLEYSKLALFTFQYGQGVKLSNSVPYIDVR